MRAYKLLFKEKEREKESDDLLPLVLNTVVCIMLHIELYTDCVDKFSSFLNLKNLVQKVNIFILSILLDKVL